MYLTILSIILFIADYDAREVPCVDPAETPADQGDGLLILPIEPPHRARSAFHHFRRRTVVTSQRPPVHRVAEVGEVGAQRQRRGVRRKQAWQYQHPSSVPAWRACQPRPHRRDGHRVGSAPRGFGQEQAQRGTADRIGRRRIEWRR